MALIYSLKFEPNVAMAWITASMIGTLQGWLLLEPLEAVIGTLQGEFTDTMSETYMEKMDGDRIAAAQIKWKTME